MRLLVVGGSAGIGRAVGLRAAKGGAAVAFAARRSERLDEVVREAGGAGLAVRLDVRDEVAIGPAVDRAVDELGGLDAVVYAAGTAYLAPIEEHDLTRWRDVLETNLVGVALVAAATVSHLTADRGVFMVLSSTTDERPRWGLEPYGVSKAAVNRLVNGLRMEHRDVRFVRATIGNTVDTEFAVNFTDAVLLREAMTRWVVGAQHTGGYMQAASLGDVIVTLLDTLLAHPDVDIPSITVEPPGGPVTMPPSEEAYRRFFEE